MLKFVEKLLIAGLDWLVEERHIISEVSKGIILFVFKTK